MLLAVGGDRPSGIEGWVPVNESVASAMSEKDDNATGGQVEPVKQATGEGNSQSVTSQSGNGSVAEQKAENGAGQTVAGTSNVPEANAIPGTGTLSGINGIADDPAALVPEAAVQQPDQNGLISINAAGSAELQEIPGIGEKKAQAIIDYRNANGPFKSVNDLTNVKGIGDKMLEKMKPHIGL